MVKINQKSVKAVMASLALSLSILAVPANYVKAEETSTGYWTLTSEPDTKKGIEEYNGTTHKMSYEVNKEKNTITHYRTTSYSTQADGLVEGNFVTVYSMPPANISGLATVTLTLSTSVDNNMKNFIHSNTLNVYFNNDKFYRKSDNSNEGSNLSISTGPNHVLSGSETVYYKVPNGKEAGETMEIRAETTQGQSSMGVPVGGMTTTWSYKWVVQTTPDPTPAPTPTQDPTTQEPTSPEPVIISKLSKGVVAKISNVKGPKAKVTVKTVSGATKYQIRYKVGNDKKWKTAKKSSSNVFTIKVKKGKKISVQARVINDTGAGAWGKTKKFKTDRK